MRIKLTLILQSISLLFSHYAFAQVDTSALKKMYDRVLDFNESNIDSIEWYANYIDERSKELSFKKGKLLSTRLRGIQQEYLTNYNAAIRFYLESLEEAQRLKLEEYESSSLGDLAIIYSTIKNPTKAIEYLKRATEIAERRQEVSSMVTNLSNLGAAYNQLRQPDTALVYLNKAMSSAKGQEHRLDLSSLYNNMGNAWFYKKEWAKALSFFQKNYTANLITNDRNMLWYDALNISDVNIELRRFDSASKYLDEALALSKELSSRRKEADVYQLTSKFHFQKGNYKLAYQYLEKWHSIDTSQVNEETRHEVTELLERFNVKQKEQQNRLLALEVDKQKLRTRNITIAAVAASLIALGTGFFFVLIRRKNNMLNQQNQLINRQNQRLSELNAEKNSLISIVSHDLSSPFTSIKMWNHLLQQSANKLDADQQKAVDRIQSSAESGETLIRNILDIEKAQTNLNAISLENFDLRIYLEELVDTFVPQAKDKRIDLHFSSDTSEIYLLSDKELVRRICDNLLSNAIKYTNPGKNVYVSVSEERDAVHMMFRDEGVGIEKEDMKSLFSRYSKLSSRPTAGENSTGLGLSIVKRIVDELNGKIFCESEPGKGSLFTVVLKK